LSAQSAELCKIAVCAAVLLCGSCAAHAECFDKAASRDFIIDDKMTIFQAWEKVLMEIDWQVWTKWMASSSPIAGKAPGWSVKNYQANCKTTDGRRECMVRATLCKP